MSELSRQLVNLPALLGAHVRLTLVALIMGVLVSIPLGVWATRSRVLGRPVLTLVSVLQTVPSLALLALMVAALSSFGFWPALLALFFYSMLPIVRNTVTGIQGVDRDVLEAATALGMTPGERLLRVELPLSAPLIVAGVRTAAVWVVGTATLSTPVGQPSLGNFIFSGLQTRNFVAVLVGCVSAALLAWFMDASLGVVEAALAGRRYRRALSGTVVTVLALATGSFAPAFSHAARSAQAVPGTAASSREAQAGDEARAVRVGAKAFTEQYVLSAAIATLLERAGIEVDRREGLGSTVAFDALRSNQIDVYVDYSGTLWSNVLGETGTAAPWRVMDQTCGALAARFGVRCLGPLGFENAYAFAMRSDRARELGVVSLTDLGRAAPALRFGTDLEFLERPEWSSVERAYALKFRETVPFDPTFMYDAVARHEVDVISAFSSDARIAELELTVLADPRQALPPYDAVVLLAPARASDVRLERALAPLLRAVDVKLMRAASLLVDRREHKKTPDEAAAWLLAQVAASR